MAQVASPASLTSKGAVVSTQTIYRPTPREVLAKVWRIWWSPFAGLVLLLAGLIILIGYQFGPPIEIKIGSGYDAPFLNLQEQHGFGGEVRTSIISNTDITDETAAGTISQTINPDWRATLSNPWQPANNRIHQTLPEPVAANYRWALQRPIVLLPGTGAYSANLSLKVAGSPLFKSQQLEVLLNGQPFAAFDLQPGTPTVKTFPVEANKFGGGSLAVELRVTNQGAPNPDLEIPAEVSNPKYGQNEGFKFYDLKLETQGTGLTIPSLTTLIFLALAALFGYLILTYLELNRVWALGATLGCLVGMAVLLATYRLELTDFATRLALLTFVTAVALPLLDLTLPSLAATWHLGLPARTWHILLLIFVIGLLLRGGGVLYPQTVVVDSPAHLFEIDKILHGQLVQEYLNKDLSHVPGQWQSANLIPYSTISYFLLAPFGIVGDPAIGVNLFNALLDALRIFVIFGLALKLGAGVRAATLAAGIYLLTPATWLLNSWGNWPTTLSLWLATLYLLLLLVYCPSLNKPKVWLWLTLLLTLTMLNYTVTAVFIGMLLLLWSGGLFFQKRDARASRNGLLIALSTLAAAILAIAIYYWQFVGDTIKTLTDFNQQLGEGNSLGFPPRPLTYYYGIYTDHIFNFYGAGTLLTLALAVFGFLLFGPRLLKQPQATHADEPDLTTLSSRPTLWFMGSWFVVFIFFGLVGWKIDMVDKQVWFVLPLAIVLASVAVVWCWQKLRGPVLKYAGRALVVSCTLWLTYSSVSLWIYRLAFKRH